MSRKKCIFAPEMYTLKEAIVRYGLPADSVADIDILCVETDAEMTFLTNKTQGYVLCYSYTIVTCGWVRIQYNGTELTLRDGDLYIYSPGCAVNILAASDDYRGLCLMADEQFTFSLPTVRNAIRTAYFTAVELKGPRFSLSPDESRHLQKLMQLVIHYQCSSLPHAAESLRMAYSLFLNDLNDIEERSIPQHRLSSRVEEIFTGFLLLLPKHFAEHHDIGFYSDELCITTTYLSRIVRQVSGGRTVVDYIDQLLLMEAMFLLQQTPMTVAQIADRLHFADSTTFARFFHRHKGCTPKEFRSLDTYGATHTSLRTGQQQ